MPARTWRSIRHHHHRHEPSSLTPAARRAMGYVRHPQALRAGNRIRLLRSGGEAFPAMLEAIRGARSFVHLETYILRSDAVGERFLEALGERAGAGVEVRLMYDSVGSLGCIEGDFLERMAEAGVRILEYRPIAPWRRRWGLNRRDHQKTLIVDGVVGFTGGINIGAEYMPAPEGGGWHDLHARVEGPVVADLAKLFRRTWRKGGGDFLEGEHHGDEAYERAARPAPAGVLAAEVDNFGMRERSRMHAAYRHAIHAATDSIAVTNAYFIPDLLLRRALRRAVRRGVHVRVIVPHKSDVRVVLWASRHLYRSLLRGGVRIFEYQDRMMHAKAAVVDGLWSTVGSYNLDRRSFFHNMEVGLVIADPAFAVQLQEQFERDVERCREITLAEVRTLPWWTRMLHWSCYQMRYWL